MTVEPVKLDYHPNWLRIMYIGNIFFAGAMGIGYLVSPSTMASVLGGPAGEPLWAAGYAYSYMVALGLFAILGLRSPLKFSATLLLQATGKIIWILAVFAPTLISGSAPSWTFMFTGLFVVWIIGDLIAVPWRHFLSK